MTSALLGPEVRIETVARLGRESCRCGRTIASGAERFVIARPPSSLLPLLDERGFCSKQCVRAFMLETLSELETRAIPPIDRTVTDLRETYLDLSRALSDLSFDLTDPVG